MDSEDFNIVSWNIGSLKSKRISQLKKEGAMSIESWFSHVNPTIVAFQETWWKSDTKPLDLDVDYRPIHEPSKTNGAYSLAFYLHPSVALVKSD